jgi:hypothetical protein
MSERHRLSEEWLHRAICDQIDVDRTSQGYEVTLPQAYHTGHAVVVVVQAMPEGYLVHDSSYAAMLLEARGVKAGAKQQRKLSAAVAAYGCELASFRVQRSCRTLDELALTITLVGSASRLVADSALSADAVPMFNFRRQLLGKVSEIIGKERIREDQEFPGSTGSKYKVGAVVLDTTLSRPVAFVEAVSDHDGVARRFREFFDLSENPSIRHVERVVVYDDKKQDITPGDVLLLQRVSNAVRYVDVNQRFSAMSAAI